MDACTGFADERILVGLGWGWIICIRVTIRYLDVITGTNAQLPVFGVTTVVLGVPLADVGLQLLLIAVRKLMLRIVCGLVLLLLAAYCRLVVEQVFVERVVLTTAPVDAALALQRSRSRGQRLSLGGVIGGCGGERKVELARWSGLRCGRCNYDRIVGGYL